jgi:hypothetical protein
MRTLVHRVMFGAAGPNVLEKVFLRVSGLPASPSSPRQMQPISRFSSALAAAANEFIRRFLLHTLLKGFHRIRHHGLLAGATHNANIPMARMLLAVAPPPNLDEPEELADLRPPCPCCGGRMIVVETVPRWWQPRGPPAAAPPTRSIAA